jgi:hypothetical protein
MFRETRKNNENPILSGSWPLGIEDSDFPEVI